MLNSGNVPLTNAATAAGAYIMAGLDGGALKRIGAIVSFSVKESRQNTRRFELDAEFPGRTVEIIPGKISDVSLTIKRALLFKRSKSNDPQRVDTMSAISDNDLYSLLYQRTPFVIERYLLSPANSATSNPDSQILRYNGCFFSSINHTFDISSEWMVIEDANVDVSYVSYDENKMI